MNTTNAIPAAPDHRNARSHKASWRRFRRSYSRAVHLQMRDDAVDNAKEADRLHTMRQHLAIKQHGPIRRLVSGGICEYWPRDVKNMIGDLARLANEWDDVARDHHKAAGLRSSTFGDNMPRATRPPVTRSGWYDGIIYTPA